MLGFFNVCAADEAIRSLVSCIGSLPGQDILGQLSRHTRPVNFEVPNPDPVQIISVSTLILVPTMAVESGRHKVAFTSDNVEELLRPELEVR